MKKLIVLIVLLSLAISCQNNTTESKKDFTTLFETSQGTETPTYDQVISYYQKLANTYPEITIFEMGLTDSGKPLHLVVYDADGQTKLDQIKDSKKQRVLVNNGIHPGESDGIDASMLLLRDLVQKDSIQKNYKNSLICIIPMYNIGGALNRNSHTRANQNGPKAYGFRGNARNYDLNRDFIKQDTKNAAAFAQIFHAIDPDIFIDNHVSNGADYQYAITHLLTQHNKLGGSLGKFMEDIVRTELEHSLAQKNIPITPYVNVWGSTPESGWAQFYDSPRYSTGYTTLFNTLGMMVETHMLKPYKTRVEQTYALMFSMLDISEKHAAKIKQLRADATTEVRSKKTYPIQFKADRNNPSPFNFLGYEGSYIDSKVTSGKRLFYDKTKPYTKTVNYYNNYIVTKEITIPEAYILEQGWHKVTSRLKDNQIEFTRFQTDTTITVAVQHIAKYDTRKSAYEGHYLHYNTTVTRTTKTIRFRAGDLYIPTAQKGIRYLIETLEAEAPDSFFNWNFFDTILQQKEGYSAYVFEDIAEKFLQEHPEIQKEFEERLKTNPNFAVSPRAQLYWIYKKSPHYEKAHMRLPIYKVL